MQISGPTQRLCRLLADWPRQSLFAWLAEQPSPLEALATKAHPLDSWRRKTPNQRFVDSQGLPKSLAKFFHVAVGIFDEEFPPALKHIPDPPLVLFCLGNLDMPRLNCVSVVGARRCSTLGKTIAHSMGAELAELGCCVVSGLAIGVDAAAHRGALSDLAANILGLLATEALQFDEIRTMASASAQQVSQGLIELQLAGFVRQGPDGYIRVL